MYTDFSLFLNIFLSLDNSYIFRVERKNEIEFLAS